MGAGIALEFRLRYPEMFNEYVELCKEKAISIGKLWKYCSDGKVIINFPSKYDWRKPSRFKYIELGLQNFLDIYTEENITSAAFPVLGASKGGLSEKEVIDLMKTYLSKCDIPIEIYRYNSRHKDDIFEDFKGRFLNTGTLQICKTTGLGKSYVEKVKSALENKHLRNLSALGRVDGIGIVTLTKCFEFTRNRNAATETNWFGID